MAVSGYASNNKAKLTTAGRAGIAAAVGFAVAGPLVFDIGSYFGSKALKEVVGEDNQSKLASAVHSNPHNAPNPHPQQAYDPLAPVAQRPLNQFNSYNAPTPHSQQAYDPLTPLAQMSLNHSNPHTVVPTHCISQHSKKSGLTQQTFDPYAKQSQNSSQLLPQNAHTNALTSQQRNTNSYSSTIRTFSEQVQGTQQLPRGSANHTKYQYNIPAASQSNVQGYAAPTMHQMPQQGIHQSGAYQQQHRDEQTPFQRRHPRLFNAKVISSEI